MTDPDDRQEEQNVDPGIDIYHAPRGLQGMYETRHNLEDQEDRIQTYHTGDKGKYPETFSFRSGKCQEKSYRRQGEKCERQVQVLGGMRQ